MDANGQPDRQLEGRTADFLEFCSHQLKAATAASQQDMDALALRLMDGNAALSSDVLVRLQSIDRVLQRLSSVGINLEKIQLLIRSDSDSQDDAAWLEMLADVKDSFTTSEDRRLFRQFFGEDGESEVQTPTDIFFDTVERSLES